MKDPKRLWAVFVIAAVFCAACTEETFTSSNDYDAVVTIENKEYDYQKNRTYAVHPEVADLSNFVSDPYPLENREVWEELILSTIDKNMVEIGYQKATGPIEEADVVVGAGMVASENWAFYSYGYYPWWGWYGWYYYPYATVAVDFSAGSVVLVMIDPDLSRPVNIGDGDYADAGGDGGGDGGLDLEAYEVVWSAGLHGLLSYITQSKVKNGIDQAFKQSEYLRVGGVQ